MSRRAGVTVVEALVALLVGLAIVQLSLGLLARARTAQRSLVDQAETLAALRVGRHVLRSELRVAVSGRDWLPPAPDSLALRVFRGVGLVCPDRPSADELLVAYEGLRSPDPEKDSVLLLDADGAWSTRRLEEAWATEQRCAVAPDTSVQLWRLSPEPPADVVLGRIFERGSYHVSDGALRYRPGAGGRQPLTPEVLDTRLSGFRAESSGVALELVPGSARRAWRGLLTRSP